MSEKKHGISVSWLPLAWMSKVLSRKASENDHFCEEETRKERVDKRDAVCMNAGKKKAILEAGFGRVLGTQFSQDANLSEKEKVKTFRHAIMYDIEAMLNAAKHQKVTDGLSEF